MDTRLLLLAILVRVGLVVYGIYHDKYLEVKYTDIDYTVFTEASQHTFDGGSPYQAPTYKYTPLLALMLLPNVFVHILFGKILFCVFDVLVSMVMHRMLTGVMKYPHRAADFIIGVCWLFNPFTITISSRGNAEAIQIFLVITALYFVLQDRLVWAGIFYGLSVHFKIYPVIYGVPFLLYITYKHSTDSANAPWWRYVLTLVTLKENMLFGVVSLATFVSTGFAMYCWLGFEFIEHTYLFHLSRVDTQHNFSPYFYILRVTQQTQIGNLINRLAFVPQFGLIFSLGAVYHKQLPLALLLQTVAFVALNKVCTSQYFIWYIGLLPLAYPYITMTGRKSVKLIIMWLVSQGVWLLFAYLYEFRKLDVLFFVWLASLSFLFVNLFIIYEIVKNSRTSTKPIDKSS